VEILVQCTTQGDLSAAVQSLSDECMFRASKITAVMVVADPRAAEHRNRLTAAGRALEAVARQLRSERD